MLQPAPHSCSAPRPRSRARPLALPPSTRRRAARVRRRSLASYAALRRALGTLLALPPESPEDAERAVAAIMQRVRAG